MAIAGVLVAMLLLPQTPEPKAPVPATAARQSQFATADLRRYDAASQRGLQWLAAQQQGNGAWTGRVGHKQNDSYIELLGAMTVEDQRQRGHGHIGVTALCGMAFLAGGHLPDRGPYRKVVQATIDYLLANMHENGFVSDAGTRMYSHAFATLFLAEVYGSAGGKELKQGLERAVNLIVDCQNQRGGWRYNAFDRELDLSVTVCQLQALRAARNIGIQVPHETVERAIAYVQKSRVASGRHKGQFYYKIYDRGAYEKDSDYAINAAALTALTSAGIYDPALHDPALDFLERSYAEVSDYYREHYYFWYGNYYACQAFFQRGGDRFSSYYQRLTKDILECQQDDGRWRNSTGPGDEFSTAMACIMLQLAKQYLPIFQR